MIRPESSCSPTRMATSKGLRDEIDAALHKVEFEVNAEAAPGEGGHSRLEIHGIEVRRPGHEQQVVRVFQHFSELPMREAALVEYPAPAFVVDRPALVRSCAPCGAAAANRSSAPARRSVAIAPSSASPSPLLALGSYAAPGTGSLRRTGRADRERAAWRRLRRPTFPASS